MVTDVVAAGPYPRQRRWVALVALLAAAVNLRLAVTSVGPVLSEVRSGLHMSPVWAGLLASLPAACFASVGLTAPRLARRFGAAKVITAGLCALAAGLGLRGLANDTAVFLLLSVVSLAGIAVVNVLLPVIVKRYFAGEVGTVTGLYSVALNIGASTAAAATVPLREAFGGWRPALACWAVVAVLAVPAWFPLLRGPKQDQPPINPDLPVRLTRHRIAWALAAYFGLQSTSAYVIIGWLPQIYRDAGISAGEAGVLFALTSFLGVPLSFALSATAGRLRSQSQIVVILCVAGVAGYAGLWWSPAASPWLWAVLLGIVNTAFPLALTMIALRGRSPETVVKLSAFAQGVGYLIAIPFPILVGVLHQHTGGWRAPIALMIVLMIPQLIAGVIAGRDRQI